MFLAEFKRRYEKELEAGNIKNPFTVPDLNAPYAQNPAYQRKMIRTTSYIEQPNGSYYGKNGTKFGKKTKYNSNLRTLLGGTNTGDTLKRNRSEDRQNVMNAYRKNLKQAGLTPEDMPLKRSDARSLIRQNIRTSDYKPKTPSYKAKQIPDPWNLFPKKVNNTTITPSYQLPKQPLALPPARTSGYTPITNTQVSGRGLAGRSNSAQNMTSLMRTTSSKGVNETIKAAGMNKYLKGGLLAGAGLLGVGGAYGLYRRNRDKNKNKR